MKTKNYLLGSECPELEELLSHYNAFYENYESSINELPLTEQIEDFRDRMKGVEQVNEGLKKLFFSAQRAVSIAACALAELERIKQENPGIRVTKNYGSRCKDPEAVVSTAALLLSEFTPGVQERLTAAIFHGNCLFGLSQLDDPLEDVYTGED